MTWHITKTTSRRALNGLRANLTLSVYSKDALQEEGDQAMVVVTPRQRRVQRSPHMRMNRGDLSCFLLVLLVLLGIIADKVAICGIAH